MKKTYKLHYVVLILKNYKLMLRQFLYYLINQTMNEISNISI